MVFKEKKEG